MRAILLCGLLLLPLGAGPQTPDASVATTLRDPVFYRGECVRTTDLRDDGNDACPRVRSYKGWSRAAIATEQKARKFGHVPLPLPAGKEGAPGEVVVDQWPAADRPAGWPRSYPVVVIFGKEPPPQPDTAPDLETLTLKEALVKAGSWTPNVRRTDNTPIDPRNLTPEEAEGRVLYQRPRYREFGRERTLDLYVQVKSPDGPIPTVLRKVPLLIGQLEADAQTQAKNERFIAQKAEPRTQESGRVEYQSPAGGGEAVEGSVIESLIARREPRRSCPEGEECRPPPEICCKGCEIETITKYVPDPFGVPGPERTFVIGAGAAGAGAAGGYTLARLLRRRSQDEDEDIDAATLAPAQVLRARVHVDRRGEQEVRPL